MNIGDILSAANELATGAVTFLVDSITGANSSTVLLSAVTEKDRMVLTVGMNTRTLEEAAFMLENAASNVAKEAFDDVLLVEAHLTFETRATDASAAFMRDLLPNWKYSAFAVDEVDGIADCLFATAKFLDYESAAPVVAEALETLGKANVIVGRWKIERTLADSKLGSKGPTFLVTKK